MKYTDIKPYTLWGNYAVDVPIRMIPEKIKEWKKEYGLEITPDFQRAHVWSDQQRSAFMEHVLKAGRSGRDLLFNSGSWMKGFERDLLLVDGKQRLTTILMYFKDEVRVFEGHVASDFEDKFSTMLVMRFHVNNLPTKADILQWYIDLNSGGTPHTKGEIEKVKKLLAKENGG